MFIFLTCIILVTKKSYKTEQSTNIIKIQVYIYSFEKKSIKQRGFGRDRFTKFSDSCQCIISICSNLTFRRSIIFTNGFRHELHNCQWKEPIKYARSSMKMSTVISAGQLLTTVLNKCVSMRALTMPCVKSTDKGASKLRLGTRARRSPLSRF